MATKVNNPILPGFNPDPCILRVENDYYIATSTFEWFPGVQIHHSTDLVNWEVIARPLDNVKLLDMKGCMFSDGVWAPCLTYDKGTFYLVYTNVRSSQTLPFKDTPNYLITAPSITGPWSDPVYLNSSGFDPSLFHDDDGKKYIVNMEWDFRKKGLETFSGILLQEYDPEQKKLVGDVVKISKGTSIGITEGPHLYKRNGYYYLMVAEGGTGYEHSVSLLRSRKITGPYEKHPQNPLLTAWEGTWPNKGQDLRKCAGHTMLKKAGHASLCQGKNGEWYLAHLCGRPVKDSYMCVLGRETALQEVEWREDDWCYLKRGGNKPYDFIEVEKDVIKHKHNEYIYHFKDDSFLKDFQSLRVPLGEDMVIDTTKGVLKLRGRESIYSQFRQTLLARRQQSFKFEASTTLEFHPTHFDHMAGLIYRYCEANQYYIYLSYDEEKKMNVVTAIQVADQHYSVLGKAYVNQTSIRFVLKVNEDVGQFYYEEHGELKKIGEQFSTLILSDEAAKPFGFTGAFVGICVQDLQSQQKIAEFKEFIYKEN